MTKTKTYIVTMKMISLVTWEVEAGSQAKAIELAHELSLDEGDEAAWGTSYRAKAKEGE